MTIILFLVDTSGSMNQRTHFGARPALLDVAKDAVEKFLKIRQRDAACRADRYMLLTFEDPPANVKAGWKESHAVFMNELKNLSANGMTSIGAALKNGFDLLNINRMQTGIDTYGQGRCPFFLEPSMIILITDGGKMCNTTGVHDELNLPMHSSVPGSELTKEPFRWDQRLFSLVLRLTGTYNSPNDNITSGVISNLPVPSDDSPINAMCEVTGGRSFCITSQRTLMASLEQLIQKIHSGVVINFEKMGPDPPVIIPNDDEQQQSNGNVEINNDVNSINGNSNTSCIITNGNNGLVNGMINNGYTNGNMNEINNSNNSNNCTKNNNNNNNITNNTGWHNTRKLIYVQRSAQKGYSVGHWPIPESFWPDLSCPSLPPRTAHPIIKFTCTNSEPAVIENLPFDKYELEPSPLTNFILSRKQPHVAWQVFVSNSHKSYEHGLPFGYLKASTTLTCVNLFVLPYNYPILLPLLEDLFKLHQGKPSREWKIQFDNYLKNMPLYYASPLKRALQRMGASPNLVPDNLENCLSYPVLNYLKRLKNTAKTEYDKIVASVGTVKPTVPEGTRVLNNATNIRKLNELGLCYSNPYLSQRFSHLKNEFNDFQNFVIRFRDKVGYESRSQCYRNAYDISRDELLDQIARMRSKFLQSYTNSMRYQDEDQLHSLPISQMGNYQEYLKRMPLPLRELESAPVRQHMFGNPFKIDKRGMMIDEADIDLVGGGGGAGGGSSVRSGKRANSDSGLGSGPGKLKRRPGPLPKDYPSQRPYSPNQLSPPPSPSSLTTLSTSPPTSPIHIPLYRENNNTKPTTNILKKELTLGANNALINNNGESSKTQEQSSSSTSSSSSSLTSSISSISDTNKELNDQKGLLKYDVDDIDEEIRKPLEDLEDFTMNFTMNVANQSKMNVPIFTPVNGRVVNSSSSSPSTTLTSQSLSSSPSSEYNDKSTLSNSNSNTIPNSINLNHIDHNGITTDNPSLITTSNNNNGNNNKRLHLTVEELQLRLYLIKLVRKPGKKPLDELLQNLSRFQGPLKDFLINEVINEATRFKRKSLVERLTIELNQTDNLKS